MTKPSDKPGLGQSRDELIETFITRLKRVIIEATAESSHERVGDFMADDDLATAIVDLLNNEHQFNHPSLLTRFVKHVVENEGPCYIDWIQASNITDEEQDYLASLAGHVRKP